MDYGIILYGFICSNIALIISSWNFFRVRKLWEIKRLIDEVRSRRISK